MLVVAPCNLDVANGYVDLWHRHHDPDTGAKFCCLAVDWRTGEVHGAAIVGRPKGAYSDDGLTAEVTRLATDGTPNACSILYAACRRAAFAIGYAEIQTYVLETEPGTSLLAAGWELTPGLRGGVSWNTPSKPRGTNERAACMKRRWFSRNKAQTAASVPRKPPKRDDAQASLL